MKSFLTEILFLLILSASICGAERDERVFRIKRLASINLLNLSGDISVGVWDKNEVLVVSQKLSPDAEVNFHQVGDTIRIEAKKGRINHQITTPKKSDVDLHCVNGNVSLSGLGGKVEAGTVNGNVFLSELNSSVLAKTVNGTITVRHCQSDSLTVSTINGALTLDEVGGKVSAKSVNGEIRFSKALCTGLSADTNNGDIVYEGQLLKGGLYRLTNHSGKILILLPADAAFEVIAKTFNGIIESEFPLKSPAGESVKMPSKTSIRATHGDGQAVLDLKTFSGVIRIDRIKKP